jgi:hypothetical protein
MSRRRKKDFNEISGEKKERFFIYGGTRPVKTIEDAQVTTCYELDYKDSEWIWKINNHFMNLTYEKSDRWEEVSKARFDAAVRKFKEDSAWQFKDTSELNHPAA